MSRPTHGRAADAGGAGSDAYAPERPKTSRRAVLGARALSPVLNALSEREFQREVLAALRSRGWICWHVPQMKRTTAGLPDILAIHAGYTVMLALELKKMGGKPTPIQQAVIDVMRDIPGVEARIVRPSDWPALLAEIDARTVGQEADR